MDTEDIEVVIFIAKLPMPTSLVSQPKNLGQMRFEGRANRKKKGGKGVKKKKRMGKIIGKERNRRRMGKRKENSE